jgi:hypothetical protein
MPGPRAPRLPRQQQAIPQLAWSGAPAGTQSFALICHDPDVPSKRRRREPGRPQRAGRAATGGFFPLGADRPAGFDANPHRRRRVSADRHRQRQARPGCPHGSRHGINDYTGWFAGDGQMKRRLLRLRRPLPAVERRDPPPLRVHRLCAGCAESCRGRSLHGSAGSRSHRRTHPGPGQHHRHLQPESFRPGLTGGTQAHQQPGTSRSRFF